jgi:hypothetical protein
MKFAIYMAEAQARTREVEARRFSYYVENVQYWFAVHKDVGHVGCLAVSHWDSGKRVALITPLEQIAAVGMDEPAQARAALGKLVAKHGAARVASVLRAAKVQP